MQCIADFGNEVQGCVISVEFERFSRSTARSFSGQALRGRRQGVRQPRRHRSGSGKSEQEAHQERLSVLGEIAAVMAHELNNPLAAISMFSQMLLKGLDTARGLRSHAEVIYRNTESCKATIRSPARHGHHVDLRVRRVRRPATRRRTSRATTRTGGPPRGVAVTVSGAGAENGRAFGDELQLRQAVVNLVMNAIQASRTGDRGEGHGRDRGPGRRGRHRGPRQRPRIPPRDPGPHLRTVLHHEAAGGGHRPRALPTSRRIVDAGRPALLVETGPGRTVFEIVVPRAATVPGRRSCRRGPFGGTGRSRGRGR